MALYANIIIDISHEKLDRPFQYRVPEELKPVLKIGMQVLVPFGSGGRELCGHVVELTDQAEYDVRKIKEITEICKDSVAIESQLIALAFWMKKNYGGTMNQALKTVIPIKQRKNGSWYLRPMKKRQKSSLRNSGGNTMWRGRVF